MQFTEQTNRLCGHWPWGTGAAWACRDDGTRVGVTEPPSLLSMLLAVDSINCKQHGGAHDSQRGVDFT